ncbi:MAG TPA: AAA family ATPase [Burkholderiaceae bacterium]|nr:AAA family ATPase [Burkholderiaceae bacterium]
MGAPVQPPPRAEKWHSVTAEELCRTPPETPPELIHGLLYQGGTMIMSGASKSHKTYTMLAAGAAIASGNEWLGLKTTKTPVLYLNLELQDFAIAHRLHAIAEHLRVPLPRELHLLNLRGSLVTLAALVANIGEQLKRTGAGLVVIDPHYKISSASGVEENSNDSQALFLYQLEAAICAQGSAVMLAHHFAKGDASTKKAQDRGAGGGTLARWPDVVMTLTEHEEPDCATAEFSLRNFAPIAPFVVRWQYPCWVRAEGLDPADLKQAAGRKDEHPASALLERLVDGMSQKEWRDASRWSPSTFKRKKDELISTRMVRLQSGCFYREEPQSPDSPQCTRINQN